MTHRSVAPGSMFLRYPARLATLAVFIVAGQLAIGPATAQTLSPAGQPQSAPPPGASDPQKPAPPAPPVGQVKPDEQPQLPTITYDVVVSAPRMELPLKEVPAATSVVEADTLKAMPRGIGAEEAFKLVPGVKIDNQADGERVHVSIRGQGLLTERGVRGIKVLLDGLPLNDPTGLAPDLFDVDWLTVSRIEVLRGPSSALYGGGAAGGVINITTRDGAEVPVAGEATLSLGSYDFWKGLAEVGGTSDRLNYRLSVSRNSGDGYRVHTAFDSTNIYGKLRWTASPTFHLTAIAANTAFFNQNAEGLSLVWLQQSPKLPNPDALTFNEYQRTERFTTGVSGYWAMTQSNEVTFSAYLRHWNWRESVPSSVQHRTYNTPGFILQYANHRTFHRFTNHVTIGTDVDWQGIDDVKYANLGAALEGTTRLADQRIDQRSVGIYALDRVEFPSGWALTADIRSDWLRNSLSDNLSSRFMDLSGQQNFGKTTGRVGASYNITPEAGLYASWGQGFLPPTTEELSNNPDHLGGFNANLVPATSQGEEVGARGHVGSRLSYDATFFNLNTDNDFGRYRVASRSLETFYRNAGSSRRYGIETAVGWFPVSGLAIRAAYTWSNFKYTNVKSLFGEFSNSVMPNSPAHQFYADGEYTWNAHWVFGVGTEMQSGWFVDQSNVASVDGFTLVNPRVAYRWTGRGYRGEISLSARNVFGQQYIAFTEPDPDGNSYQPGPTREVFFGIRILLGQ
ncbi:MAG: TonB-dependent receptor [Acidobacteria bacterium]|nr:TonB-dependent receptor [Acidobacteriota bacterium]